MNLKTIVIFAFYLILSTLFCNAQQGSIIINHDKKIEQLLDLKKEINTSEKSSDRYKIQIYSGDRTTARSTRSKFRNLHNKWPSTLVYETPNYKIWVGNFRTSLEADRVLNTIIKKFPSAFIFKPKKELKEKKATP